MNYKTFRRYVLVTVIVVLAYLTALTGPLRTDAQARSCPGAPQLRLTVGMQGQVAAPGPGETTSNLRVRLAPGTNAKVLGRIHSGDTFKVTDGPICTENLAWWKIATDSGLEGWVAEGDNNGYFIEPAGSQPTPTIPPPQQITATATPVPRG